MHRFDEINHYDEISLSLHINPFDEKSQNCVKAVIAFVCTNCKRQLLFALLQQITNVCTSAIESIFALL